MVAIDRNLVYRLLKEEGPLTTNELCDLYAQYTGNEVPYNEMRKIHKELTI